MRRSTSILLALAGVALAGCGDNGFGVDLTVTADSSVSDAALGGVRTLSMSVTGAESYETTYPLSGSLARTVKLVYRPGVTAGALSFALTAVDGSGAPVAFGHADGVALKSGSTVAATVTLSSGAPPMGDGGACPGVTQCMGGDGCCPTGCDQTTDSDCSAVCGNNVVEQGEACDDGNTTNGDGCDTTCHFSNVVSTFSGAAGGQGYFDAVTPAVVRFATPAGVATDGTFAYVADNNTIRSVRLSTGATATLAGSAGVGGPVDGVGTAARFGFIRDIEYVGGALYLVDGSQIRKLVLSTKAVTTLAIHDSANNPVAANPTGIGTDGSTLAVLDSFTDLWTVNLSTLVATKLNTSAINAVGASCRDAAFLGGNYYVACQYNVVKQPGGAGGAPVNLIGAAPSGTCAQTAGNLCSGLSIVAVSSQNLLYVMDNGGSAATIRVVNPAGPSLGTYAGSALGYADSTTLTSAQFRFLGNGRLATAGTTLVATDDGNAVVRTIASTGTATVSGVPSSPSAVGASGATSRYTSGALRSVASDGTFLYFAEQGNLPGVRKVAIADGASSTIFDTTPTALTVIGNQLYLSFGDNLRRVPTDGSVSTLSSTTPWAGVPGVPAPPKDGPIASAQLVASALTTDGTNVFFVDATNHLVRKIDVAAGMVTTLAGTPGTRDVVDGTGAAAHFRSPGAITTDGTNLYVLDAQFGQGATVVRKIEPATGKVTTVAGAPDDIGGVDGTGTAATFAGARGLACDGTALFITDAGHSWSNMTGLPGPDPNGGTIRELVLATGAVTTMAGTRGRYTTLDGTGSGALFSLPDAITYDATAQALFLFDDNEGVVRQIK